MIETTRRTPRSRAVHGADFALLEHLLVPASIGLPRLFGSTAYVRRTFTELSLGATKMQLVEYSDDDSDEVILQETQRRYQHGPRLLDPGFHEHTRLIDHADGFWPTHVYLEYFTTADQTTELVSLADSIKFNSLVTTDLGALCPLHISLSETLLVPLDAKDRFLVQLEEWSRRVSLGPQDMSSQVQFLENPTKEKVFAVIPVKTDGVSELIADLNKLLASPGWDLPQLSPLTPHLSFAVGPADPKKQLQQTTLRVIEFKTICVRMGTRVHTYALA